MRWTVLVDIFSFFSHKIADSKCSSGNNLELLHLKKWKPLFKKKIFFCVCCIYLCLIFCQSKLEVKKEAGESPPSEAACLCSPPPAKNQCASCGMEIQDRYLLKVRNLKSKKTRNSELHIMCWDEFKKHNYSFNNHSFLSFCFSSFSFVFLTLRRISLY